MGLCLSKWKRFIPKIIWGVVVLALAAFIVRVMVWEYNYYHGKEGSERAVPAVLADVDETEITEEQVAEYKVAADRPRYLTIDKLQVKTARILEVGTEKDGKMATPNNIFDTGWYFKSGKPGQGGTVVIVGHNGGPTKVGVFKYLPNLDKDDIITVERGDGTILKYAVKANETVPLSEADGYMNTAFTSPEHGKESITLISCTGDWSQAQQTYLSRQFVRAVLVDEKTEKN